MMIPESDFRVQYLDSKSTRIRGSVSVDPDGFATIFINPRLDPARQLKTFEHELQHFTRNDLYNDKPIHEVERKAAPPAAKKPKAPVKPIRKARVNQQAPLQLTARAAYLRRHFDEARAQMPAELRATMDALFSHPVSTMEEMYLRGFLLYGLQKDSHYWKQILLTYSLYGNQLPEKLPGKVRAITGTTIPYEIMKLIIYSLVEVL